VLRRPRPSRARPQSGRDKPLPSLFSRESSWGRRVYAKSDLPYAVTEESGTSAEALSPAEAEFVRRVAVVVEKAERIHQTWGRIADRTERFADTIAIENANPQGAER